MRLQNEPSEVLTVAYNSALWGVRRGALWGALQQCFMGLRLPLSHSNNVKVTMAFSSQILICHWFWHLTKSGWGVYRDDDHQPKILSMPVCT